MPLLTILPLSETFPFIVYLFTNLASTHSLTWSLHFNSIGKPCLCCSCPWIESLIIYFLHEIIYLFIYLFLLFSKFIFNWRYNCFTMLCWFLTYHSMNQSYVHKHTLLLGPPSHLPPHPIPLGHHRAPGWAPCVMWQLPTSSLSYLCYAGSSLLHMGFL